MNFDHHYVLVHDHRYGTSVFPFRCNRDDLLAAEDDELITVLCEKLGVDFEPERDDERVTLIEIGDEVEQEIQL